MKGAQLASWRGPNCTWPCLSVSGLVPPIPSVSLQYSAKPCSFQISLSSNLSTDKEPGGAVHCSCLLFSFKERCSDYRRQ